MDLGRCEARVALASFREQAVKLRGQSGQATVLVIGLSLVTFAAAGIAVDGTRAFLFRRTLQNIADSTAVAAASEIDTAAYYASGGRDVQVDVVAARREAAAVLGSRGIPIAISMDADASGIAIVLRGDIDTTFLGAVGIRRLPVAVEARAEPVSGRLP